MRKFIFSGTLISAILGGWSAFKTTRTGPRDWRLALMWISWAATVAIAVGTILEKAQDAERLPD